MININKEKFYNEYRQQFGRIKRSVTVDNLNTMLEVFSEYANAPIGARFTPDTLNEEMAYVAATIHHETGGTYSAFKEKRQVLAITSRQKEVKRLQDRYWNSGYYGRGPIQLTWKFNYLKAGKALGLPLSDDPDILVRNLRVGYLVAVQGMIEGWFTGKKLKDTITKWDSFIDDRKIVNGKDQAELIAAYAKKFLKIFNSCVGNS